VDGDFEADLWLSKDRNVTEVFYQRMDPGTPGVAVQVRARNLGPSGAYRGALQIDFSSTNAPSVVLPNSLEVEGEGIRNCSVTRALNPIRIDCEIFRMPPGAISLVKFTVGVELAPGYSHVYLSGGASIGSPTRDIKLVNNGWSRTRILCGPSATDSNCPPP
jgi:hypothetical protein